MNAMDRRVKALEKAGKGGDDTPLQARILTEIGLKTKGDLRDALACIAVHGARL